MRILFAFISPMSHALSNIVDNHLSNTLFKNTRTLIFYGNIVAILFLPLVCLVEMPDFLPPLSLIPFFILLALIEIGYLFPYYKALQYDDTSIVTSLFSLGKIFVPLLAFLMVGEVLTLAQYAGFFVIVLSGALLTLQSWAFRLNRSFFYMLAVSLILSFEAVLYKYTFESVSWSTSFVWTTLCVFCINFWFLAISTIRKDIQNNISTFRHSLPSMIGNWILDFVGNASSVYVISLIPVTLAKAIGSTQPLFVLVYALILGRFFPSLFKEKIDHQSIVKKIVLFLCIIIGVIIVVR